MTERSAQFGAYFREHLSEQLDRLDTALALIAEEGRPVDPAAAAAEYKSAITTALTQIADAIASGDIKTLSNFASNIASQRARSHWATENMISTFAHIRDYVWDYLNEYIKAHPEWQADDTYAVESALYAYQGSYFGSFRNYYDQIQRDLVSQQEELERQHNLVQELGTPIVPVYEGILLIPLVGQINEFRAMRVTEQVLEAIVQQQADVLLIDITGVPVIDTSIANHLMTLTRAVRLLGTDVIMVGLGAEIAQTIVHLGISLNGIATLANLQDGLVEALRRRGLSIRNGETVAAEVVR